MTFPEPGIWNRDSSDRARDEEKRAKSPCSFFYAQGWALVLASRYFNDERLGNTARGGVAIKHRHKIHLALYGQLLASFEYMLKDFIARTIDLISLYDDKLQKCKWIDINTSQILASRSAQTTPGAILLHASQGWHNPATTNARYQEFFDRQIIEGSETSTLLKLWLLRHAVAHNAGYVIQYDSVRLGMPALADRSIDIDAQFIETAFDFLLKIARRLSSQIGGKILIDWIGSIRAAGPDYERDRDLYIQLSHLSTMLESRTNELPTVTKRDYLAHFEPYVMR